MNIKNLLKNIGECEVRNYKELEIDNLTFDSREKHKNSIYFCLKGTKLDGHDFALEAVENGAVCLVVEDYVDCDIMQIKTDNVRNLLSIISANFYSYTNNKIKIIGITGTNGKTTTAFLTRHILHELGQNVGMIGTEGTYIGNIVLPAKLTTPDAIDLHKTLDEMRKNNIDYAVMEVSAHALFYDKVSSLNFEIGVMTNITQDHLDFFGDLDSYSNAKQKLFKNNCKKAILNVDDNKVKNVYESLGIDKVSVSMKTMADYTLSNIKSDINGSSAVITYKQKNYYLFTTLIGEYNLHNCITAVAICHELGFDLQQILDHLASCEIIVPGRFNKLKTPSKYSIIIDFAHTPDAMQNVLQTVGKLPHSKIITVFGCGGNRDKTKRPQMGSIASTLSDYVIITSDNPRYEKPTDIIDEIVEGTRRENYVCLPNRKEAIKFALSIAEQGDIIMILGKGNENYQEINGVKKPFSDYQVVDEFFEEKIKEEVQ